MKKYTAYYKSKDMIETVVFNVANIKVAKSYAQLHKRLALNYKCETSVKLKKDYIYEHRHKPSKLSKSWGVYNNRYK